MHLNQQTVASDSVLHSLRRENFLSLCDEFLEFMAFKDDMTAGYLAVIEEVSLRLQISFYSPSVGDNRENYDFAKSSCLLSSL